ncbi:MAG: DUF262 domain-containing protein [Lachnospiraceae bacterium]|nr:DUF262 domain-containing protein [Lachnospiraceae bacterium]
MKNEWKTEEFSAISIQENIANKVFVVPRYQRGVVWKDQQRADLVDTIKKGLPFGTLLLYRGDDGVYQIIDGLQRSNAIIEFVTNPTQFFEDEDIDISVLRKIVELADLKGNVHAQEEKIKGLLIEWVKSHKTLVEVEAMQFSKFGKEVSSYLPTCKGKEFEIGDLIEPMMKNYQEICKKISDTKIPAIVLSGEADLLPVLFERINSKGTQLSKYQIYAATWSGKKYKIGDKLLELVKANRDRYDQMLDGNGTIDEYDSSAFMMEKELDAFEIAFGLGKFLSRKWPYLFGKPQDEKSVESIGFTLMTTCLGMKNQQAKTMNVKLDELIGEHRINEFLNRIIECVAYAEKYVGKFSKFKSNSRSNAGERPLHTEFQIASVVSSVFLMKYAKITRDHDDNVVSISYDFAQAQSEWNKTLKKAFEKNVAKIFIMESLQKRWSGTGDKKLDMILVNPGYYTKQVTEEDFETVLDAWFDSLNDERAEFKRIANPKEQELIILSAIYLCLFSAGQQIDGSNYDIEHLATQNLMKKHLDRFDGTLRLPISSIGNLCLLPEYANRSKRDKTIYDDTEYLKKSGLTIETIEEKYSFTKKEDLEWISDYSSSKDEFEKAYMSFIKTHFNNMKGILLKYFIQI